MSPKDKLLAWAFDNKIEVHITRPEYSNSYQASLGSMIITQRHKDGISTSLPHAHGDTLDEALDKLAHVVHGYDAIVKAQVEKLTPTFLLT